MLCIARLVIDHHWSRWSLMNTGQAAAIVFGNISESSRWSEGGSLESASSGEKMLGVQVAVQQLCKEHWRRSTRTCTARRGSGY